MNLKIEVLLKVSESVLKESPKQDKYTKMIIKALKDKLELIKANKKLVSKTRY